MLARGGLRRDPGRLREIRARLLSHHHHAQQGDRYPPAVIIGASAYEFVMALHVVAVVAAFGVTFAYPIMFAAAARSDPRSLPLLYRLEYTTERWLINPGLF